MLKRTSDILVEKMLTVNTLLQEVNDTLGPNESELEKELKLRFPRGYIRTANDFRKRLICVKNSTLKSNIAYQLMLSDLFSWLINRTDLFGTVKEMLIKYEVANMASIAETLTVIFTSKNKSLKDRLQMLLKNDKITGDTAKEVWWLWKFRQGIHLFEIAEQEYNKYEEQHFDRAAITVRRLLDELNTKCI
jgi:hypothetical protein